MASKAVRGAGRRRMELWTLCFLWGLLLVGPHATAQSVARDQDEGGSHPPEVPEENVDSMFESEALLPIPKKPKNKPQTSGNAAGQPLFFEPGNPQSAGRSQVTPPLQQFLDVANADGSRGALLSKSGAENSEVRSQQRGTGPVEDRPPSRYSAASNRNSTAVVHSQSSGSATNKGSKADGTGERTAQTATLDSELSNPDSSIDDVLSAPPLEDDVLELEDLLPAPSRIRRSADNSIVQSGDGCADNSSCPATEECVSLSQGMYCVCRSGYVRPLGNGTVGDCIDIDECTEDTENCTNLEVCQNTPGAFTCNCRAGYRRTNSQCSDINECFEDTHNCTSPEVCQNTPGAFTCNCRDGYRRTNSQCSDINECAENNNCTSLEVCQNTPGAYICNCKAGYRRSINNQCANINECAEGSHNCGPYQVCQDTQGSFVCGSVDLCASNRHTCTEFEVCLTTPGSFTCNCRDNFRRNSSGQCDPFYAYGYSEGDSRVAHYDDVTSPAIYTSLGLPVGESRQQRIYVGSNGIISFGQAYNPYYPPLPFQGGEALAPFWADINVYGYDDAQIFYHVYDGNGFNPDSRTETTLNRASADVQLYMRRGNFRARWALVATWDNVPPYAYYYYYYNYYNSRGSERITFQCVLVTDGQESYALYFYRIGAFNWNPLTQRRIVIGYTQPNNDFRMDMNSLRTTAYSMDQYRGNTGYRGFYVHKVGEAVSYAQSCLNWYYRNYGDYNFRFYQSFMPLCPCAPERLRWDRRWGSFYWWNNIYRCVQMRPQSWLYPYGKECCYLNGLFVSTMPNAGSAQRYHPWYDWRKNQVEDVKAKEDCCQRSPYCHLYYQLRPTGYCAFMSSFQEAALFGDPHILTLDGRSYTFNGWGEYNMLRVKTVNESFVLQGRTSLAETENGTTSNATIFSAFAAKDSQNASLHVELNTNKTGMIIYGAGIDHTAAFHDNPNFEHVTDTLVLSRENDSLAVSFSYSGISLTIHLGLKLLTLTVSMPTSYKGLTRGLLGNFNGNKTDDFQMRNGSILSDNATEEQIFTYFGNSWMITPNESVFRYPQRTRPGDFQHLDFKPIFLDQVDPDLVNRSYQVCGGKDNIACVYDFVATGSQQVAVQSRITSQDAETSQTTLGNNFPNLTASNYTLNVLVRQTIEFNLYGEDVDPTDTVTYFSIGNSTELSVNKSSGAVTYTPGDTTPTTLSFYAEDNGGLKSQVITIITIVCNNCSGNGACNYSDTNRAENNASNPNYRIATCECGIGWTGADCETDINSCAENPCLTGQNCTDLDPAAHQAQAAQRPTARPEELGYNCSACPQGYVIRDLKCQDFDECNNTADNTCGQRCINTPGSYSCDCFNGYRMVTDECQDVDECLESTDGCEQMCINQPGNFSCDCNFGYALKADGKTCNQTLDICTIFMPNCTYGCRNASSGNGLECFCPAGFQVNPADGISCIDVNECNQNPSPCLQTCTNSNGSFACSCYAGYTLNPDKVSCSACGDNRYGVNCDKTCQCGGRGVRCDPVTGCVCEAGWTGENCTQDFDECASNLTLCGTAQTCVNSVGSYQCRCPSGYTEVGRECQDVNECGDVDLNNCTQTQDCSNVVGSYQCICRSGYQGENCTDIDECASSVSGCQQVCQNVPGSFNCLCNWGYELGADRKSCQQVENVCATYGGLNCTQGCTVDAGSTTPYCFCNEGYQLATDDQTCLDIDECTSGSHRCSQTCENTMGNYRCSCRVGFSINADGRTCTPCDSNHWGSNCSNVCDCAVGAERCNSSTGCVCKPGWTGVKCEFDRNECDSTAVCPELADCFNTPGSYQCRCRAGYSLSNFTNTCEDVDECLSSPCDQLCENTVGSFVCKCNPGFTWNGTRCLDVDECANAQHGCQHFCRNAIGSYACYCRQGFTLSIADKRSCIGNTQCAPDHNCTHTCEVRQEGLDRVDLCTCHRGYRLAADNRTCLDVNECTEIRPCMQVCSNTPGSYNCSCQDGFSLQPDNINCRACEGRKWGPECRNNCTCDPARTLTCNATNGYCTCMPGWEGANCMRDIDECNSTSPYHVACPAHSTCNNTVGSYSCICDVGYKKNSSRLCEECDPKHWGLDCANPCSCALTASACNRVTGACTCRPGYTGADCATDINECATNATNCTAVDSNSQCRNTPGSYECVCVPGYRLSGGICQDINECLYPDTCQQTCTNREGSFACGCRSGYILVNTTTCQDVDECANSSLNTCQQTCTNTPGNFSCGCSPGYSAVNATHCQDINECTANSTLNTCEQRCTNEIGNFSCSCWSGYSLFNSTHCRDVDECAESSHNCTATQNCANIDGSFNCSCKPGYEPNGADCTDIDECASNSTHNCFRANEFCVNENGTFRCDCASGFFKVIDGCQDIDYCNDTSLCSGNNEACRNLVGGYECYCVPGFYNATGSCTDVDECMNGTHNCTASENCNNTVGGFTCECKTGYLRNGTKCEDVDECTNSSLNTCQQTCTNTPGNFSCGCWSGYSAVNATHCQDVNECAGNSTLNTCEQRCNNEIGNFSCSCWTGYVLINFTHCRDIDECATNPCDQSCTNTDGSFQCGCLSGYVLFNSTHCQDVDECTNSSLNTCEQTCVNSPPGNFSCGCWSGFALANATHCQDIDECQQDNDTCTSLENCINFDGGFNCTCKSGFIRNGSICEDVDECENNSLNCTGQAERCENTFGGFTCACVSGYERTGSACTDVDECLARTHNCTARESCNNTVGGFTCPCKAGYVRNDTHCDDVDECMNNTHNCTQRENCHNTVGGFTCQCKAGYVRNDTRCDDIDECQQNNSCSSLEFCTNVDGGFNCTCMGGYTRDNGTCVDVNECTAGSHNCSERENCVNSNGGFSCTCKSGYLRNGTACSDIDECATNTTHNCTADHEYCFNTDGGFECNCEAGFFKVPNGCSSFDYCNNTSLCSGNNEACRNLLGGYECYCLPGFSNTTGTCADVDECLANTLACTERENCINTPGNFTCQCKSGFVRNDTRCDDVDECMNNTHNCTVLENCQNTVGGFTCQCKAGYVRNDTRCDDVDECMNNTHNCTVLENCQNTVGGFTCQCKAGYVRNGTRCDDVDECQNSSYCSSRQNCINNVGGYTCVCKSGYSKNGADCDDINECTRGEHNCSGSDTCINTIGSFTCQCLEGSCTGLYSYGTAQGDLALSKSDDVTSPEIRLAVGFPVGSTRYSAIYVGSNGVISFYSPYNSPYPSVSVTSASKLIAPFWADIDIAGQTNSNIFYHVYDGSADSGEATAMLLRRASEDVRVAMAKQDFKAVWALVATWDSVPPYSTSPLSSYFSYLGSVARDGSERVTFQCVLVTDGQESFALVYYKLNSFTWRYKQGRRIVIGSVGVNDVFLETIHSLRTTAYGMDQLFGNTGVRGFWAYQVGKSVSYAQSCRDWYDRNRNDWLIRSNEWWIPMCPCAPERRFWDRRWGRMYSRGPYLCMSLRPQRWLWPLGKECCYYNGIFESSMPGAGSVYRYHPWYDYRSHQIEDVRAKENCCERSSLCKLYYELRPTGGCTRFVSWRPTALFGDPHILTLDGKSYTFNGWGEYTMLDVDTGNQTFVLQARTSLAVTENGTTSNATIFSAFAAKDSQNASLHVELDVNKTGMIIFGNERDHTAAFRNETFEYDDDTLALSRENGSLVVSFAQSGISLTISLGINMLTLTATLPITMKNTTKGLLGNFNDNATDDFLMRNGTYLPSNASEEDIFTYFGRDWEITQEESVFRYPAGQNSTHFQHNDFQPIFLDQVSEQLRNESYTVCGGRQNLACVYDYVATGSRRIASASNTSKESAVQAQILLTKEYPNIASLNETIRVQVNSSFNFTLSGQDPDSSIVYYFSSNTSDQVIINRTTGVVMYNPKSLRAESLSFYAVDGDGLKSPIVTADVVLCSGCSGHGTCNYSDTSRTDVNNASNPNFRLAACTCNIGWTGPDCESDFNACASNPCSQGQNCTDLDPAAHQAQTRPEELGYICSACPQGFQLQSGKCMDIDECNRTQSPCDQVCQNTDGSYVCLCRTGYRRNAGVCTDINECQEGTSGCEQGCTNTAGNFTCSCETGYNLQANGKTCVLTDENLCASIVCQYNCRRGASGSPECFCPIGKTLQSDGKTCQDIDECTTKPCAQTCTNTDPGFQCSCYAGYKLATDKVSCTPCEDNQYGEGCSQTCQCGERARGCDPVAGCQCQAGWMGQNCMEDVDECTSSPCVKANEICVNTPGTFECQCQPGYKKDGENCTNIDECSDVTLNNCTQGRVCRDTAGSYACDCLPGYGGPDCSDIDECATVLSGCEQNCINTDGSYRCECYLGYRLKSDRKTCEPDGSYPCGQQRNCSHGCTVKEEIQTCFCNSGWYLLASDNRTCIDQDECVTSNTCSAGTNYCNNTPGGFTCSCPKGSSLEADLRTCRDCDNAHWGDSCTSECRCGVGGETCDRVEGCKCKLGFSNTDGKPCEDVDECKNSTTCGGGANCTNTVGSFRCTCSSGYTYNETTRRCVDVDECVSHSCAQVCHNTIGNYYCSCNAGFTGNGLQCEDIDECASNPCPNLEDCTNIPGSHRCSCNTTVYRYADNTCYYLKVYPVYVRLALVFVDTPAFKLQVKGWMKNHFNTKIGLNAVVDFTIYSITNGSTIVNGTVDVDKSVLAEPDDRVAAAVVETREGIPMGNGTTIPVDYIEFNDQQVTAATTKCEVYTEVLNNKCNDTYECVDTSGSPKCVPKDTGVYSVGLIIGLSVGIPFGLLFIIAVVTTIVYCRIKAKRKAAMESPLNYYQNVRQAFGSSLPTRHHGKNKLLYQPDSLSSGSTGVGGQDRRLGRGRHDFKDSAWYDNSAALERGAQVEPRSNFSWDFMYDALPPDRQYNLPRPRVNLQPNETMTPSRQRPDSMA